MRYTRYEYKKSGKLKFLCSVAIITGISIGGGLYISNVIFNGKEIQSINKNALNQSNIKDDSDKNQNIIVLQCGYYSKEENAKDSLNSISKYCQPFIVEDDGKYRVIAGMYTEEDAAKKIEEFKAGSIDVAKINLSLSSDNIDSKKIIEIINGFLTITSKLQDNQVKSIKTDEFKTWSDKIINDGNQVRTEKLKELNDYVNNLPEEIDKTNNDINMQQIYKLIKS